MISLLLATFALADPCAFPDQGRVLFAAPAPAGEVALVEETSRCLYFVAPGPRVRAAYPLPSLPSDLQLQADRLLLFFPATGSLEAWRAADGEVTELARITPGETCTEEKAGPVTATTCRPVQVQPFRVFPGRTEALLHYRNQLIVAPYGPPGKPRAVGAHRWLFVREISFAADTGRVLALENQPNGESIVTWYVLNHRRLLLAPVPELSLLTAGLKRLYFLPGDDSFLATNGLVYRVSDFSVAGDLGQEFDEAHFAGGEIVTIKKEQETFKATVFDPYLRPAGFEYFFQKPLLVTKQGECFLYLLPRGSLREVYSLLPRRPL